MLLRKKALLYTYLNLRFRWGPGQITSRAIYHGPSLQMKPLGWTFPTPTRMYDDDFFFLCCISYTITFYLIHDYLPEVIWSSVSRGLLLRKSEKEYPYT